MDKFREVVGNFATGVTIVTARGAEGCPNGFTANAFTSLSLHPPQIIVCVDKNSDTYPAIQEEGAAFAVNILAEYQEEMAQKFAAKGGGKKFEDLGFYEEETGAPVFEDVLAYIECEVVDRFDGGDHTIIVGEVQNLGADESAEPLTFFRGSFGTFQAKSSTTASRQADLVDVTYYFGNLEGAGL